MANTVVANTSAALAAKTLLTAEDSQIITGNLLPSSDSSVIGLMRRSVTPLTNAQIKALPTTAITVVTAPSAGIRIKVQSASFQSNTVNGAYTGINATYAALQLLYSGDANWLVVPIIKDTSVAGMDRFQNFLGVADALIVDSPIYLDSPDTGLAGVQYTRAGLIEASAASGVAVEVSIDNNGTGNLTGGHALNTMNVVVYYMIETIV